MPTDPVIPTIDYTSRDYLALRDDMIRTIRVRMPQWTAENPSDFGVALVEAFAYGLDTVHYYIDRVANEAYLPTAVQRESLYSIAEMFNYTPRGAAASMVRLEFQNTTTKDIDLEVGTRCTATIQAATGSSIKNFETTEQMTIPAKASGADPEKVYVWAQEGRTYKDETVGVSTGFVAQQYFLPRTNVLQYTTRISTELTNANGAGETSILAWEEIQDLKDAYPTDRVFQVFRQTDGSSVVRFGDGFHGAVPDAHAVIKATYRSGGGADGNVPKFSVATVSEPVIYGLLVTNTSVGAGGTDQESLSSIRINAARSFRSRDRAVTLSDYVAVTETAPGVSKAKAVGNNGSSVTMYICPTNDGTGKPTASVDLRKATTAYLDQRAMAGVTVQAFSAVWQEVFMRMKVYCHPAAKQSEVEAVVRERLAMVYGFDFVVFNGKVTASDITRALTGVKGMDYVEILDISLDNSFPDPNPPATPEDQRVTRIETIFMNDIGPDVLQYYNPSTETGRGSLYITMVNGIEAGA